MTKLPFTKKRTKAIDMLELVHTNIYDLMTNIAKVGFLISLLLQ